MQDILITIVVLMCVPFWMIAITLSKTFRLIADALDSLVDIR